MTRLRKLDPYWLRAGTEVGPWKVKAFHAGGSFGAVFRAVLVGREHRGLVALKVAWYPSDPRFQREVELLSRLRHGNVPQLMGHGEWKSEDGVAYPYLVMEWVEGLPLEEWAGRYNPSSQEACRVLAQVARALEATHAAGGLHRDVKGGNILVGRRAFLTDFGAGNYRDAQPLTHDGFPPGTDTYRSPEAWEFALHRPRNAMVSYQARPSDDVYALGVSAFHLVTNAYPPSIDVREDETGASRLVWTAPRPPRELNARVSPELAALIQRMVAEKPEDRPTAGELAELLEKAARNPSPGADRPLFAHLEQARADAAEWARGQEREPAWKFVCAVLGGALVAVAIWWALGHVREQVVRPSADHAPHPVGLGDTTRPASDSQEEVPSSHEKNLGLPVPEKPFKGQRRAPRCHPSVEVNINGGCWIEAPNVKPPCGDEIYEWKGRCYVPTLSPPRPPTSETP
ncbi:serine/threonine protein kinase [Hyalangium rubrum]|uniref:Serine/threonine-protein kinase n=1 Tax=Hyalangium rubrum TaxID=3103134 RepID=A0ABU5H051_9BACT|nr:serine/threonine-protein kinase [Hyalangium sp. s54d21]MDY7226666.1 serine/threonine-protein kinase [Hyalangium sp. s54d21]